MHTFMNCSLPTPPFLSDESDEPQAPPRSPSRLDFCMEDLEDGDSVLGAGGDSEVHSVDWACTPFRDPCLHAFTEEDAIVVNVAPPDRSRLLTVEGGEDPPPQATDSQSHENADISHTPPIPRERPTDQVVIEPQSPIPVRPLLVQFDLDVREDTPPSRSAAQRLNYPHHGLSRSALQQQKTLWNSRHEEWAEWRSRIEQGEAQKQESDAYTGLATIHPRAVESPPSYMRTPPSGLERDLADHPARKHEQDVHASIFPRVGDISALRDPYSVNIDRCFFKFPLWTIHKMLYVFDMHQRSASLAPPASVCNSTYIQASTSSSTLSSYTSSTSGDEDSDSTLVADDSPIPAGQLPQGPLKCASSPRSPSSWNPFCIWDLSWYARWEMLIGLFQRDHTKYDTFNMPMKLAVPAESKVILPSPPGPILPFTVGEDKNNNYDDEDDDYGTVVSDPTFGVDFDEECERAMAFFNRESKYSEMVL